MPPEAYAAEEAALTADLESCRDKYPPREDTIKTRPSYFNSGCCRYADGDITGIELAVGEIRLIKWENKDQAQAPIVLEKMKFEEVFASL